MGAAAEGHKLPSAGSCEEWQTCTGGIRARIGCSHGCGSPGRFAL